MYRGSSFLLQKDYKVHIPVVKIIMEEGYNPLAEISTEELMNDENMNLLEEASTRIRKAYAGERPSFEWVMNNAIDTLVTKILLGTLGCVSVYDRHYVQAVKQYGISSGGCNKESVRDVAKYYLSYRDEFESDTEQINEALKFIKKPMCNNNYVNIEKLVENSTDFFMDEFLVFIVKIQIS